MSFAISPLISFDNFDSDDIKGKATQSLVEGGPNSGFEFMDEDFFKDPELSNAFPEMKEDIDLIVSTEAYIGRLVDFDQRMKAARGMDRGMALELFELIPDLQSYKSPNHFTEGISGVGWEVSCEEISNRMWVVIAAAAAFVLTMIYKFMRWIFGGSNDSGGAGGGASEMKQGLKETEKSVKVQSEVMSNVGKLIDKTRGQKVELNIPLEVNKQEIQNSRIPQEIKDTIDRQHKDLGRGGASGEKKQQRFDLKSVLTALDQGDAAYEYLTNPNKYARVVYTNNRPVMDLVTDSYPAFRTYAKLVRSQLDALSGLVEDLKGERDHQDAMANSRFTESLRNIEASNSALRDIRIGQHTFASISEWGTELTNLIVSQAQQARKNSDLEDMIGSHQDAVRRLSFIDFNSVGTLADLLEDSKPIIEEMQKVAEYQQKKKDVVEEGPDRADQANLVMRVYREVAGNLSGLMKVYAECSRIVVEVNKHGLKVIDTLRRHSAELVAAYNRFDEQVPPSLEDLYEELTREAKRYSSNMVGEQMKPKTVHLDSVTVSFGHPDDPDRPSVTTSLSNVKKTFGNN